MSRENSLGKNGIEQLTTNIQKLEKLERRLMRGGRSGNRKKSMFNDKEEPNDTTFGRENRRKAKKEKKNWRFAYDLYCKELMTGNQPNSTQRSQPEQ